MLHPTTMSDQAPLGQGPAAEAALKIAKVCSTLMVLALLSGCAEPRLDASSEERVLSSTAALRGELGGENLTEFDSLMSDAIDSSRQSAEKSSLAEALVIYNGMTAREIVDKHRSLREAQAATKAARDKEVYSRIRDAKAQATELQKVHISDVSIGELGGFVWMQANINNGLPYTITSLDVGYELRSPGRELPWVSGDTTFHVSGGIESGELVQARSTEEWTFLTARKRQKEHPEAVFNLIVHSVRRADGTSVPSLDGISDEDFKRFAKIESETGAAQTNSAPAMRKE